MIVEVVGAVIRDADGRLLTVRKQGTGRFMLPGGKREPGEDDRAALARELAEELSVRLVAAEPLGVFEAPAANEPGAVVRSHPYAVTVAGKVAAGAEIAELRWIDVAEPGVPLAPLLERWVLPLLSPTRSGGGRG
ncbi:NUDIX domain-containing protein [Phenylobacterium sp.]|uniref:NUDIX hydrolase n=1 Tax=Phenylobacterium sp. TaxID=1871053 RepID=UPI002BEC6FC0|nr:NUDIX domain-containing protein [Phenylobacterium sp.]HVI30871.1 NUDIX domain-containing protein [Phenylobacterium sp.]